jgi:hypothetical protein
VEQELREYDRRNLRDGVLNTLRPADRLEVLNFWRGALPDAAVKDPAVIEEPEPEPEPMALWGAMAVALGTGRTAVAAAMRTDLRQLLQTRKPGVIEQGRAAITAGSGPARRWWRRWWPERFRRP